MSKDDASELINEVVEKQPKTKKKGCFRTLGKIVGVLFLLFLIWYLTIGRGVPLRISPETTWITEPRTPDGKWIDYCGAFEQIYYPPEMKTDENGYRIIVRHLGLPQYSMTYYDPETRQDKEYEFDKEALRVQGYEKLGLDPNIPPDMVCKVHELVIRDYVKEIYPEDQKKQDELWWNLYNKTMSEPWTLEEYPMLTPWVEQNFPILDMVSEAVAKPTFRTPLILPEGYESLQTTILLNLDPVQQFRSYARELQTRFQYRLGQGDINGAISDKMATHRLGRHAGRQGVLVSYLVGLAIDGVAYAEGIANNLDEQPTVEQIRELMRLQTELQPTITIEEAMESERLCILDGLQVYARGEPKLPTDVLPPMMIRPFLNHLDWNIVFRRVNQYLDGELTLEPIKPSVDYFASFLYSRNKRSENFIDTLASLFFPAVNAAEEAKRRLDCCGNMQQITLAMLLYAAENGTLPPAYSTDENGKPLHSWRVLLLPYLGDEQLTAQYEQIRLDEPWDSEHNRQFHDKNLTVYRCPSFEAAGLKPGETGYCVIIGEETPFGDGGIGKKLSDFGTQSTQMPLVAERRTPGNWMDPTFDVTFEQAKEGINGTPEKKCDIGSFHTGGANFGLRNGAVWFLSETIESEKWENLLQGKEKIE